MPDEIRIVLDGVEAMVPAGSSVAAALLRAGSGVARRSVTGAPRGPLCGMGVCQECRVTIGGRRHQRACMMLVHEGMEIGTGGSS